MSIARIGGLLMIVVLLGAPTIVTARSAPSSVAAQSALGAADWRQIRDLLGDTSNAVSPVPVLSHQAYLKASNTGGGDNFSYSVAIDGDIVVVGAYGESSSSSGVNGDGADNSFLYAGAAYVFTRDGGTWSQQAYLKASNTELGDSFGISVAVSGETIVVGAPSEDSAATTVNGSATDNSAFNAGAAYVFTRNAGIWSQQAYLKASNSQADDNFGTSVSVSGDTIVVGAAREDSNSTGVNGNASDNSASAAGAAYVFTRNTGVWSQQAYLKASNTEANDFFAYSVAVSGEVVVVGAISEDSNATTVNGNVSNNSASNAGAAYVFTRNSGIWSQQAYLKASNAEADDSLGYAVAVSGDSVVVGAPSEKSSATGVDGNGSDNSMGSAGAAYVFTRAAGVWTQQGYLKASNTDVADYFGASVAISSDTIVVGAPYEDSYSMGVNGHGADDAALNAGAAYVFSRSAGAWSPHAYLKPSNTGDLDNFGWSIAVSDGAIVVGAYLEDSGATGIDGDATDNSADAAGAAYIYGAPCATAPFGDVLTDHPFCAEIEWMSQTGVSTGFPDDTFRPGIDVTRQAMSAFLARFAGASLTACAVEPFLDVPVDHPFCAEIAWMADNNISTGFDDGTYRPGIDVTRQAMSAFLARIAGATLTACATEPFPDVPVDHPFCDEITWMKESGISTGFGDGTYRPGIDVTRQAMSAFLHRLRALLQ